MRDDRPIPNIRSNAAMPKILFFSIVYCIKYGQLFFHLLDYDLLDCPGSRAYFSVES